MESSVCGSRRDAKECVSTDLGENGRNSGRPPAETGLRSSVVRESGVQFRRPWVRSPARGKMDEKGKARSQRMGERSSVVRVSRGFNSEDPGFDPLPGEKYTKKA